MLRPLDILGHAHLTKTTLIFIPFMAVVTHSSSSDYVYRSTWICVGLFIRSILDLITQL